MLPTSYAYRKAMASGAMPQLKATLTLADGTTIALTGADLALGGLSVSGAVSQSGMLAPGAAITGTCTLMLFNSDGRFDAYDFEGATLVPYAGATLAGGSVEWARLGTYGTYQPATYGPIVELLCEDNMRRFATPYSEVATAYPATLATIVSDVCTHCGVTLGTSSFPNSSYRVTARPTGDLSCADVIAFSAQAAGCWARMDPSGYLRLEWFDGSAFSGEAWLDGGTYDTATTPYSDGDAALGGYFMYGGDSYDGGGYGGSSYLVAGAARSLRVGTDDIEFTGVSVTASREVVEQGMGDEGETVLVGSEGYVLEVANNPLVEYGRADAVAANVAAQVVGLTFRAFDLSCVGDPTLQAGDAIAVTDELGRTYRSYVTQAAWSATPSQSLSCQAVAPSRKAAKQRSSALARALAAVRTAAASAANIGGQALAAATAAAGVANAINQHFWTDSNGVHVTEATQEAWAESESGPNLLANSLGILLRDALVNLVSIARGSITFYDGIGNLASNVVAAFGQSGADIYQNGTVVSSFNSDGMQVYNDVGDVVASFGNVATIGRQRIDPGGGTYCYSKTEVGDSGMRVIDSGSNALFGFKNMRESPSHGNYWVTESFHVRSAVTSGTTGFNLHYQGLMLSSYPTRAWLNGVELTSGTDFRQTETYRVVLYVGIPADSTVLVTYYAADSSGAYGSLSFGVRSGTGIDGPLSATFGKWNEASGYASIAAGEGSVARGEQALAHGGGTALGVKSVALYGGTSVGTGCVAVGQNCEADGLASVALGQESSTGGVYSLARGYECSATGAESEALGYGCTASASYSHASGYGSSAGTTGAFVHGLNMGTTVDYGTAFGRNGIAGPYALAVGYGDSASSRSNKLTLDRWGSMTITGTLTQGSDRRLKEHVSWLGEDACEFVRALRPALFEKDGSMHVGFYAQDVREADSWNTDMVRSAELDDRFPDGVLTLDYIAIIAPLVAHAQALERRVRELEWRLSALDAKE